MAIDLDGLENAGAVHARAERRRWASLCHRFSGVADLSDLIVTQRATGANRSVDVSPGGCFIDGSDPTHGLYHLYNTAVLNLPLAAADPSNPRTDAICAVALDTEQGDLADTLAIGVITGVAGAGAPTPTIPTRRLLLATVRLNAGVTTVTNPNITDARKPAGLAKTVAKATSGGYLFPVAGSFAKINFGVEIVDYSNAFTVGAAHQYVCLTTGTYEASCIERFTYANAPQFAALGLFKNGVEVDHVEDSWSWNIPGGTPALGLVYPAMQIPCVFGDVLDFRFFASGPSQVPMVAGACSFRRVA